MGKAPNLQQTDDGALGIVGRALGRSLGVTGHRLGGVGGRPSRTPDAGEVRQQADA
jgi:hypothetical protein